MKKALALLMALLLCAAFLAACGGNSSKDNGSSGEVTVEETTVLDEKGITAVVKGYDKYEGDLLSFDRVLLFEVTNKTEKAVSFGLSNCSVNGVMTDANYSYTIEAGKTEPYPAVFDETVLDMLGVTVHAEYEFCITINDDETYETLIETDPISIKTSAYDGSDFNYDVKGTALYDADGVKIIALDGLVESEFFGQYVNLLVINDSDKYIDVAVAEGAVNGQPAEISVGSYTPAGKRSVNILSIDDEEKPEKIESFTLSFTINDWDTGETIVEKTDPVTINY